MTEKEINLKYIRNRLKTVVPSYMLEDKMLHEIYKMLQEVYIEGLRQKEIENILQNTKNNSIITL